MVLTMGEQVIRQTIYGASEYKPCIPTWPEMDNAAFYGLAGEFVELVRPHTESDDAGLLVQFLVAAGNATGRGPYYEVEGNQHTTNLFTILVGETSKARKGTSWGRTYQLFRLVDSTWVSELLYSGLSSGEGLI